MKLPKYLKQRAGFTMIELLVVIAVIGVLAVAVLSSINPIEQINKGRDTRIRSDAAQLLNAIDRYYAAQAEPEYPWNTVDTSLPSVVFDCPETTIGTCTDAGTSWIQVLTDTAETKPNFQERVENDEQIYVHKPVGELMTVYACFDPTSKQFSNEALQKCTDGITPLPTTFCNVGSEYICLP